jgi:hypothetical protein
MYLELHAPQCCDTAGDEGTAQHVGHHGRLLEVAEVHRPIHG